MRKARLRLTTSVGKKYWSCCTPAMWRLSGEQEWNMMKKVMMSLYSAATDGTDCPLTCTPTPQIAGCTGEGSCTGKELSVASVVH
mmetsp:Transcript_40717/g.49392  ORF Transcript_40717/g.49392 Transcript_40717/m.49392 type:complete len:85 (+) Transcript_40717:1733-1987(+)